VNRRWKGCGFWSLLFR